ETKFLIPLCFLCYLLFKLSSVPSGTNSEGQVKYCRCTFFGYAAQERVPTAFNVGSHDVTWASRPTPLIPFRAFSRVSRAPFLRQSGVVTETQFLIGLRVLCGLLCICSSSTGYRW